MTAPTVRRRRRRGTPAARCEGREGAQLADQGPGPAPRAGPAGRSGTPPTWSSAPEALAVCLHRPNRRRVALIAATVGTILVAINQGGVIARGNLDWVTWVRIALDYLIPTCVSTMGVLAGSRRAAP